MKWQKDQYDTLVNIQSLIMWQLDRINILIMQKNPALVDAVEALELMMKPFHDDKYLNDTKEVDTKIKNTVDSKTQYITEEHVIGGKRVKISKKVITKIWFEAYKQKYGMLSELIGRIGFYAKQKMLDDIEEDDYEDDE